MRALAVAILVFLAAPPAFAFDHGRHHGDRIDRLERHVPAHRYSRRSLKILAADACWRGCTAQCGSDMRACMKSEDLGACVAESDACHLFCQRECRISGGPLVNWTD